MKSLLGALNRATPIYPTDSKAVYFVKKLGQRFRRMVTRAYDPVVDIWVEKRSIKAALSHNLPNLLSEVPNYDRALPRIAKYIKESDGYLCLIDVGANIGDTVNMIDQSASGDFLCLEPSDLFFDLLEVNTRDIPGAVIEKVAVGEKDGVTRSVLAEDHGTAYLVDSKDEMTILTIDSLVEKHPTFQKTNILKIDTDGFDYKVLRGSTKLLSQSKPFLFFEVSPEHLIHVGEEDPLSIYPHLAGLGYSHILFYDQSGLPIAPVAMDAMDTIRGVLEFTARRPYGWLDALAVHHTKQALFKHVVEEEYKAIPRFVRPYFA